MKSYIYNTYVNREMMNQQHIYKFIHAYYPIVINVIAEMELESGDRLHISAKIRYPFL